LRSGCLERRTNRLWIGRFGEGSIGQRSPWERHLEGEELLHILEGAVEVTLLLDSGPAKHALGRGIDLRGPCRCVARPRPVGRNHRVGRATSLTSECHARLNRCAREALRAGPRCQLGPAVDLPPLSSAECLRDSLPLRRSRIPLVSRGCDVRVGRHPRKSLKPRCDGPHQHVANSVACERLQQPLGIERAHARLRRAAAKNRAALRNSTKRSSGVNRRIRATSSSMCERPSIVGCSSECNWKPATRSRRSSVSYAGLVSPDSILAITDCAVRARFASSRCERPARRRAVSSRRATSDGMPG
jgi:hypothetical protein